MLGWRGLMVLWLIALYHPASVRGQELPVDRVTIEPDEDWAPLPSQWRFNSDDDPRFALVDWDDSQWEPVDARLLASSPDGWGGRGWFRL